MSINLILSIVFLIIITTVWLFYSSRNWEETSGKINFIELETVNNNTISPMANNKSFTEYKINMEYSYTVDGRAYTGTKFYPLLPNVYSEKKYADELLNKYKTGQNITVYVNPKSPGTSCLITSKNISPAKYAIMIFIFIFIAAVLIFGIKFFNSIFDA